MRRFLPESISRPLAAITILFLISGFWPAAAAAVRPQTTSGKISGLVLDPTGRPVANAKVTVVNRNNGNTRATLTDAGGNYTLPFLPVAVYTVTVTLPGYQDASYAEVRIELNKTNVVLPPITINPLAATGPTTTTTPTTPTPTTTAPPATTGPAAAGAEISPLLNTTDATRRGNFNERQVETLPLGGTTDFRTFDEYALLVAGVAPPPFTPGVRGPGVGFGIGTAGQFSVNGHRARSNNFTVDGSDNNDPDVGVRRQGFLALVPQSIESIQEFQISTLLWDAEHGRNFGSQVNAVSKDGPSAVHGEAYIFFTDSSLNARNFFDYSGGASGGENPFTRTQTGIALGGPVIRDRTQFFASFEHEDVNASAEQHFSSPTAADRNFLNFLGRVLSSRPARFSVQQPIPEVASNVFLGLESGVGATPLGSNILSFYPLPNNPGGPYGENTYSEILPTDGDGAVVSFKVAHEVTLNNTLYARYNFTDDERVLPSVNRAIRSTIEADTRTQNLSLILDSTLSPRLFNQARFSYGRTRLDFPEYPNNPFLFQAQSIVRIGSEPFVSQTGPIGELIIEPFSPVGVDVYTFPQGRRNNTFQFADSMSWTWRNHSIKFGADIRYVQLNSFQNRLYRPLVIYGNGLLAPGNFIQSGPQDPPPGRFQTEGRALFLPGVALAAVGIPSSVFQTITAGTPDSTIGLNFTEYDLFFNDNWRVSPRLTLDYGLRYEYNTVPREENGRIESALTLGNIPDSTGSRASNRERIAAFNAALAAYSSILGGRTSIYEPDRNNFGPHVGFAWAPWVDGKTVLRGGYGIYYDAILGALVSQSRNIFPNEIPTNIAVAPNVFSLNNPAFLQTGGVPLILPGTGNQFGGASRDFVPLIGQVFAQSQLGGGLAFTLPGKDVRTPYSQQWHLTIEREFSGDYLVSAAYVGSKVTKLTRLVTPNLGPNVTPFIPLAIQTRAGSTTFPLPFGPAVIPGLTVINSELVRPNPALGAFQLYENSARSTYHSLQLESRKRFASGYTFTAAYTWSHALDDVSDVFPIAGAPVLPQDSFDLAAERGSANFDVRHRISASMIWDLPFYRDSTGPEARWLGGWQVATIFQANTGQPFTLNVSADANLDGNLTDRPSTTEGLVFLDGHSRERVALGAGRDVTDFFALGQNGFVGRNTARADSFINWDAALVKNFRFTEARNLIFRAEFFNVLNRANFGIPIRTIGNPGFGSAVETVNPSRTIQFALKYKF